MNVIAGIVSSIAWIFLIYSYYKNNDNKILIFQIVSSFLFVINYTLLKAYTGMVILLFEIIRNLIYLKHTSLKTYACIIPFYFLIGVFTYDGIFSLFSLLASLTDSYALLHKGKKVVALSIITYTLWIIYDIYYLSIPNIIAQVLLVISNIYILIKPSKIDN